MLDASMLGLTPSEVIGLSSVTVFGFMGSLHCSVMCGPLAGACHSTQKKSDIFLYHSSRILAYGTLGLLCGYVGELFLKETLSLATSTLAAISGLLLLVVGVTYLAPNLALKINRQTNHLRQKIFKLIPLATTLTSKNLSLAMLRYFQKTRLPFGLALGLVTAFVPCGFLYAALSQSVLTAKPWTAGLAMVLFGIATLPALAAAAFSLPLLKSLAPKTYQLVFGWALVLAGILLLMRGYLTYLTHCAGNP